MNKIKNIQWVIVAGIYFLFVPPTFSASNENCNKDLEAFLNCNNPKVMKYLTALTKKDIGKVLNGVRLTDGTMELKGSIFLGEAKGIGKGIHLFIFKIKTNRVAYLWIEDNGTELNLPRCPVSVSHESAYVLSGDVYTWKAAQHGHGVIQTMCIKEEWMKQIK